MGRIGGADVAQWEAQGRTGGKDGAAPGRGGVEEAGQEAGPRVNLGHEQQEKQISGRVRESSSSRLGGRHKYQISGRERESTIVLVAGWDAGILTRYLGG